MKAVVCMTSWPPRIDYVPAAVRALLGQTRRPDAIYLTLSACEFPGFSLTAELRELADAGDIRILWTMENARAFKKVFPVLPFLGDDDLILTCDEDIIAPPDLLDSRLADFERNLGTAPITSVNRRSWYDTTVVGVTSLFQKKMLRDWTRWVDGRVVATGNDDRTYLWAMYLNGYRAAFCSHLAIDGPVASGEYLKPLDLPAGSTAYRSHLIGADYDRVVVPVIEGMTGRPIVKSFNYFGQ